jgi:tryptophan-rich sensory protein
MAQAMQGGLRLVFSLLLPLAAGALGGLATSQGVSEWYPTLQKPFFNPPSWVFGPVWTLLYLMMGYAFFLIWNMGPSNPKVRVAMAVFGLQLLLNVLWSFLFFGARAPGWAFLEIVLLWLLIGQTLLLFRRLRTWAGWLLAPYLAWVTFAGVLNFAIWTLNR